MAGRPQRTELSEKHWQAIKLSEDGTLNYGEIAEKVGWSREYFYELRSGNVEVAGAIAPLFQQEYKKVEEKRDINIRRLVKENTEVAQSIIKEDLAELKSKKKRTLEEKKLIGTLQNALSKCTPSVSVGSVSFSYVQGLNAEDLLRECRRLKGIAEQSFNRSRGSVPSSEGSGSLGTVSE